MNIQRSSDSNTFEFDTGGGSANIGISREDNYRRSYDSDSSIERVSLKPNLTNEDLGNTTRNIPSLVDSSKSHTGIDLLINPKRRVIKEDNDTPRSNNSPYMSQNEAYHSDNKIKSDSDDDYYKSDNNFGNTETYGSVNVDKSDDDEGFSRPSNTFVQEEIKPELSYEEIMQQKKEMLYQFERLEKKGIPVMKKFTMNSSLDEMKYEYERIKKQREIDIAVKFSRKVLMAAVTGVEFLNSRYDPFDLKLDGWSESMMENIDDYDEVFEELSEKYKSKVKVAPEVKLLMMVAGSGFMYHITNTMFKSAPLPNMSEIIKENPDLMKQFQSAAVNTAAKNNSGNPLSGMMGGLMSSLGGLGKGGGGGGLGGLFGGGGGGAGGGGGGSAPQPQQKGEMQGPSNINDILNNMNFNQQQSNDADRVSDISSLNERDIGTDNLPDFDDGGSSGDGGEFKRPGMGIRPTHRKALLERIKTAKKNRNNDSSVTLDL